MSLRKKIKELTKTKGNVEPEVSAEVQVEEEVIEPVVDEVIITPVDEIPEDAKIVDEVVIDAPEEVADEIIKEITKESEEVNPVYSAVKSGDTITSIAKRFKIDLKQLLDLNPNLKDKRVLKVGQKIRVK